MDIESFAQDCYQVAQEHGWHDEPRSFGDVIALMHSELSEALEEYRSGHDVKEIYYTGDNKPEGAPTELADVIIRILDACTELDIDIVSALTIKAAYNKTRPYRHGGKTL